MTQVEFKTIAEFGKRSDGQDYRWLSGQDTVPGHLLSLAENAASVAAENHVPIVVVLGAERLDWLILARVNAVDASFRPTVSVVVAQLAGAGSLGRETWLQVAYRAMSAQPGALRSLQIESNGAAVSPATMDAPGDRERLTAFRLGLPLAVGAPEALRLLRDPAWRYAGLCYAGIAQSSARVPCSAPFSRLLCVNFTEPVLGEQDRSAWLEAQALAPGPEDWTLLNPLDPATLLATVRLLSECLRGESLPLPGAFSDPVFVRLLARFLARSPGGGTAPRLLAALLREDRIDEARALHRQLTEVTPSPLDPACEPVIAARLGLAAPAAPPPIEALRALAGLGLARPEDVVPPPTAALLAELSCLWPATAPLGALLGSGPADTGAALPDLPPSWRAAVAGAIDPGVLAAWYARLPAAARPGTRGWLARTLGQGAALVERLLSDLPLRPDADPLEDADLPWLQALTAVEAFPVRLVLLSRLAASDLLLAREPLAHAVARALAPELLGIDLELVLQALSRVGPLPHLEGASPYVVATFAGRLDPLALVDALVRTSGPGLSQSARVREALQHELRIRELLPPPAGYSVSQRHRHLELFDTLSSLPGWEAYRPEHSARVLAARAYVSRLGLGPEDLVRAEAGSEEQP